MTRPYLLKKELIEQLRQLEIDCEGTTRELRQCLLTYAKAHPEIYETEADPEGYDEKKDIMRDELLEIVKQHAINILNPAQSTPNPIQNPEEQDTTEITPHRVVRRIAQSTPIMESNYGPIQDQMRKWGCHFDGRDP